jgi:hypothetical protein
MFSYFSKKTVGTVHAETLNKYREELQELNQYFNAELQDNAKEMPPLKPLSKKYKARLLKHTDEALVSITGSTPAVKEVTLEAANQTADAKAAQEIEAKRTIQKKQSSSQTLEDIIKSLHFNSRKNRTDIDVVYDNIGILRNSMDNAGTETDYLYLAEYEAASRELICRRARNVVINVLATIEKASKVAVNEKTDLKGFDYAIQPFIESLSDVRKLVDPFMPKPQLAADAPARGLK